MTLFSQHYPSKDEADKYLESVKWLALKDFDQFPDADRRGGPKYPE